MKAFGALAAPAEHPFWQSAEEPLAPLVEPVTLPDASWVVARGEDHAVALVARPAPRFAFPEEASGKYRKFAYSSVFGFSGDVQDITGNVVTDSMLALTDAEGNRRVRVGIDAAGVEDGMTWSTWCPWPDVRIDSVCWAVDSSWHGRLHRVRTGRALHSAESGFALSASSAYRPLSAPVDTGADRAALRSEHGCSAIVGLLGQRSAVIQALAVNANLLHPRTAVPVLRGDLAAGDHQLATLIFASPSLDFPDEHPPVRAAAAALLDRISAADLPQVSSAPRLRG